jgi:sensor histidine kinase YesM
MLLQTLVENALKHGIAQRPQGGEVAVDRIHLKVSEIQTNLTEDPSKFEPPPKPAASQ